MTVVNTDNNSDENFKLAPPPPNTRIVALHGFLGNAHDWDRFVQAMHKLRPNIRIDTPDLFATDVQFSELSMLDWAEDFNQRQKEDHLEKNILVGYSMGGRLALHALFDKPGLWDDVVLVSSHPGIESDADRERRLQIDKEWANKFQTQKWDDLIREWNKQSVFAGSFEPERKEEAYSREALSKAIVQWSLGSQNFVEDQFLGVQARIHLVAGEKDKKYRELYENLKKRGLAAEFHVLRGAGHRVIFDKPEALARQLVLKLKL